MGGIILPAGYKPRRSATLDATKFRGYARHLPCNGEAFWFTRFGKAWFDLELSEVLFEDGQVKIKGRPIEEYRCPHCRRSLEGKDLRLVKIMQEDEADELHRVEHNKKHQGQICEFCGERKQRDLERRTRTH